MRWSRLLVLGVLVMAGCPGGGNLNQEETLTVDANDAYQAVNWTYSKAQTVTVTVSSPKAPVDVFVVLENDKSAAQQALKDGKKPTAVLGSKTKVTEGSLEGLAVPANTPFTLLLAPTGATTEVKVKVTGK